MTDPGAAVCPIAHTDWRNATCSDAVGREIDYTTILPMAVSSSVTRPLGFNTTLQAPFFNIQVDGATHQVWFDDPVSLAIKAQLARRLGFRGAGTWNIDAIFGASVSQDQRAAMFEAISSVAP